MSVVFPGRSWARALDPGRALAVSIVVMEIVLLVVIAALVPKIVGSHAETPSPWAVTLTVLLAFGLARWLGAAALTQRRRVLLGLLVTLLALQVIGRADLSESARVWELGWLGDLADPDSGVWRTAGTLDHFFSVLVLIPIWFRGVFLGTANFDDRALAPFALFGFAVLAIAFLVGDEARILDTVRPAALLFVLLGLATVALKNSTRLQSVDDGSMGTTGVSFAATLGVLLAAISIFVLLVIAVVSLIAGTETAGPVVDALGDALRVLVTGIAYLIWPFFWIFERIANLLRTESEEETEVQITQTTIAFDDLDAADPTTGVVLVRVFGAIAVILFFVIVSAILFRRLRREQRQVDEERESVFGEIDLFGGALAGLRSFRDRFRRAPARARDAPIAELYFDVLEHAELDGVPKPRFRTPLQFGPALRRQYASPVPEEISQRFTEFRYGGREPPEAELSRLRRAWSDLLDR